MTSLISQIFSFGIVQLLIKLKGLIFLPFLSRLIGPEGYGVIASLWVMTTLVSGFIVFGTNTSIQVLLPKVTDPEKRRLHFWTLLFFAVAACGAVSLILLLAPSVGIKLFLPKNVPPGLVRLAAAGILLTVCQLLLTSQIINNRDGKRYATRYPIAVVCEILLVISGSYYFGVKGTFVCQVLSLSILVGLLAGIVSSKTAVRRPGLRLVREVVPYYRYGMWVYLSGLAAWVIDASDRILLAKMVPVEELGVYQVAYSLASHLGDLAMPLFAVLMPVLSQAFARGDTAEARFYLKQSFRYLLISYGFLVTVLGLERYDLFILLTTEVFLPGAGYFPVVAVGIALFQMLGIFTYALHANQRGHLIMISTCMAAATNVALNLLLIPEIGAAAAAWSTLVAYGTHFCILYLFSRKVVTIDGKGILLLKTIAALTVMAIVLEGMSNWVSLPAARLPLSLLTGAGVYLGMLVLLKEFGRQDWYYILSMLRKEQRDVS